MRSCLVAVVVLAACGGGSATSAPVDLPARTPDAGSPSASDGGGPDADADAGPRAPPSFTTAVISTTHRAIPGVMFGGWGPHLGHLLARSNGEVWLADDACDATAPCDVNVDRRLDYFAREAGAWVKKGSLALPAGVQQNTGSILTADAIVSYGVDVARARLVACAMPFATLQGSCSDLPFVLPANSNYVGAAISPEGWKVVWYTVVADGGGGAFHWGVDYGGGWNGPRVSALGGYNDASYIDVAFGPAHAMTLHAQLVSGLAPNWTFTAANGDVDLSTASGVAFATMAAEADTSASTNDVWVDPKSGSLHLVARTTSGAATYHHRPAGGALSGRLFTLASTLRARFVPLADGRLVLVYGTTGKGLAYRVGISGAQPIDWASLPEHVVPLPDGYASLYAIYPAAPPYQTNLPTAVDVAIVGTVRETEVLGVHIEP